MTTLGRRLERLSRSLAVFLVLHGFAHWVGMTRSFKNAADGTAVDYLGGAWRICDPTTLRLLGVAWALAGSAYLLPAWAAWVRSSRLRVLLVAVTVPSLVLSVLGLWSAIVGVVIDVVLLAVAAWWPTSRARRDDSARASADPASSTTSRSSSTSRSVVRRFTISGRRATRPS